MKELYYVRCAFSGAITSPVQALTEEEAAQCRGTLGAHVVLTKAKDTPDDAIDAYYNALQPAPRWEPYHP